MRIPLYQIDAFTNRVFAGNPAAVCPLPEWLPEATMQSIAAENNLSETAFFIPQNQEYALRWFTPVTEVDLCGHATLASAYVLTHYLDTKKDKIVFHTRSGPLQVKREGNLLKMDFPCYPPVPGDTPDLLVQGLKKKPVEVLRVQDYFAVFESEADVRNLQPDFNVIKSLGTQGVIVTAPGDTVDFVSRYFAPAVGIPEDPVTGYAHCILTPYWAKRLGKNQLHAFQVSSRGGELFCERLGERVEIAGQAAPYLIGEIVLD